MLEILTKNRIKYFYVNKCCRCKSISDMVIGIDNEDVYICKNCYDYVNIIDKSGFIAITDPRV